MSLSPDEIGSIVGAVSGIIAGLFTGLLTSFRAGQRWGDVEARLKTVETKVDGAATKDQLSGLKEDVAEIKGMFRMTLKDGTN